MSVETRNRTPHGGPQKPAPQAQTSHGHRVVRAVVGALMLALVVAIVAVVVRSGSGSDAPAAAAGPVVTPDHLTSSGSIGVGDPDAPVTVALYFDYLCPACGAFEAANEAELTRLLEAGTIQLELRPIAFLDHLSEDTVYSTRAANALATVADAAPEHVWSFHSALYAEQPAEGGPGLTDEVIARLAVEAGVPETVASRFDRGTYAAWVAESTTRAFASGVEGTPTIVLDGRRFDGDPYTTGPLTEAIEQAAGDH